MNDNLTFELENGTHLDLVFKTMEAQIWINDQLVWKLNGFEVTQLIHWLVDWQARI